MRFKTVMTSWIVLFRPAKLGCEDFNSFWYHVKKSSKSSFASIVSTMSLLARDCGIHHLPSPSNNIYIFFKSKL